MFNKPVGDALLLFPCMAAYGAFQAYPGFSSVFIGDDFAVHDSLPLIILIMNQLFFSAF